MPNARYPGTARLFANRLPPEITDRIARINHARRVAQIAPRIRRRHPARGGVRRWVNRARRNIARRNRVAINRIALTRANLRAQGIIGPPGYSHYPPVP